MDDKILHGLLLATIFVGGLAALFSGLDPVTKIGVAGLWLGMIAWSCRRIDHASTNP